MWYRNSITADDISLSEVKFWLNWTDACDLGLQEQDDFNVIKVDDHRIKFNLVCHFEGHYTCGRFAGDRVIENPPKTLICKYWITCSNINLHVIDNLACII